MALLQLCGVSTLCQSVIRFDKVVWYDYSVAGLGDGARFTGFREVWYNLSHFVVLLSTPDQAIDDAHDLKPLNDRNLTLEVQRMAHLLPITRYQHVCCTVNECFRAWEGSLANRSCPSHRTQRTVQDPPMQLARPSVHFGLG